MPLQKLSARLATVPSRDILILSPCTLWNSNGGKLFVAMPFELDLEAEIKKKNLLLPKADKSCHTCSTSANYTERKF